MLGYCQAVRNRIWYTSQNLYNGTRSRLQKTYRYIRANQTDIFWTLVMLAFIGLLFYVFYYKGNKLDPVFKYGREQYQKASGYISHQYQAIRDHFHKK